MLLSPRLKYRRRLMMCSASYNTYLMPWLCYPAGMM